MQLSALMWGGGGGEDRAGLQMVREYYNRMFGLTRQQLIALLLINKQMEILKSLGVLLWLSRDSLCMG